MRRSSVGSAVNANVVASPGLVHVHLQMDVHMHKPIACTCNAYASANGYAQRVPPSSYTPLTLNTPMGVGGRRENSHRPIARRGQKGESQTMNAPHEGL